MDIEIEWGPRPMPRKATWNPRKDWFTSLQPIRTAPGTEARILRCRDRNQALYYQRRIKEDLRAKDPMGNWKITTHTIQDTQGGVGVWASYHGQMTAVEKAAQELASKSHSEKMRKSWQRKKLKKQLSDEYDLIHPTIHLR